MSFDLLKIFFMQSSQKGETRTWDETEFGPELPKAIETEEVVQKAWSKHEH